MANKVQKVWTKLKKVFGKNKDCISLAIGTDVTIPPDYKDDAGVAKQLNSAILELKELRDEYAANMEKLRTLATTVQETAESKEGLLIELNELRRLITPRVPRMGASDADRYSRRRS
ncbi:unnamed protein product [Owenia fusiformis]|uniref:Uncharacterized protein n=1 Tax=Owenia fusiformis TaxID=6347 RepID=A0A8S4PQ04_OWEFU|nr:unnamed protein product [Owenia fusiformis]